MAETQTARREPSYLRDWHMRDNHGRPVPFINVWSGEMPETEWQVRYDPDVGGPAIAAPKKRQGVGEPNFFKQEPRRQRMCAIRELCQVCARTAGVDRVLVLGALSCENVDNIEGLGRATLFTEPWLCSECARFALKVCPGLIRRRRAEELWLIRPHRTLVVVSKAWLEGPREEETKRLQPVLWAKLAVGAFDVIEEVPAA